MRAKKITALVLYVLSVLCGVFMLLGNTEQSLSERRDLTQWSDVAASSITTGAFMTKAEDAAMDQFPLRDLFRKMKALFLYNVMGQLDNNGIYIQDGNASRLDYLLSEPSVNNAISKMKTIQQTYLMRGGCNVYYCVVPDKNYYFATQLGYPVLDYDRMEEMLGEGLTGMQAIEIDHLLSLDSYYYSDPHWNQGDILPVAQHLVESMNGTFSLEGVELRTEGVLEGAYFGQSALELNADPLEYWAGGILDQCIAYDLTTGKEIPIYNVEGATSDDPYNFFLGGAAPVQKIVNPNSTSDKELIIFRDSFGSSIAPLLAGAYKSVTLVDIRYIHTSLLEQFVDFRGKDVLFMFSALILNQSNSWM